MQGLAIRRVALVCALQLAPSVAAVPAEPAAAPAKRPANRLATQTSPYLLLHAHNPVDWFPWGEEALAKAHREKKLIFLSVGYSSCYWCHVMERESFSDAEIAAFLNQNYVCIKVDREERPDLDEIYMRALGVYFQLTGSPQRGGWPLSMFLTPDAKPLAGGTYFPPRDVGERGGFLPLLERIQEAWSKDPAKWQQAGDQMAELVKSKLQQRTVLPAELKSETVDEVSKALAESYDPEFGGFSYSPVQPHRPKFPEPPNLVFLLDRARHADDETARKMLSATLDKMARGGIVDQLGGGFHRYSTDRYWRVPHFEKMLVDNGQLASIYARTFALTAEPELRSVAEEICEFVLRELTSPEGGFYTALDAETAGQEGEFYVWRASDIETLLSADDFRAAAEMFGLRGETNFEGRFVLTLPLARKELAQRLALSAEALSERRAEIRRQLLAARDKRPRPLTDTKILAGANGLMIRGLVETARATGNGRYQTAAERAAKFVLERLRLPSGTLLRSYAGGRAQVPGCVEDYAYFVDGLLALHESTGAEHWLTAADELTRRQVEQFWDDAGGGFFFTPDDHEVLLARTKLLTDGATPSANAVAAGNLLALSEKLQRAEYREQSRATIAATVPLLQQSPDSAPQMAAVLARWLRTQPKP